MIRKLGESDRLAAVDLLNAAPAQNLYLLGNLESVGFDEDICEFWGDFPESSARLNGVLNRYMSGWTIFGKRETDWGGLAAIIDGHPISATRLQDNPGGTASFQSYLKRYGARHDHCEELMQLAPQDFCAAQPPAGVRVRRAILDDLDALSALYVDAGEMARSRTGVERPLRAEPCVAGRSVRGSGGSSAHQCRDSTDGHDRRRLYRALLARSGGQQGGMQCALRRIISAGSVAHTLLANPSSGRGLPPARISSNRNMALGVAGTDCRMSNRALGGYEEGACDRHRPNCCPFASTFCPVVVWPSGAGVRARSSPGSGGREVSARARLRRDLTVPSGRSRISAASP